MSNQESKAWRGNRPVIAVVGESAFPSPERIIEIARADAGGVHTWQCRKACYAPSTMTASRTTAFFANTRAFWYSGEL